MKLFSKIIEYLEKNKELNDEHIKDYVFQYLFIFFCVLPMFIEKIIAFLGICFSPYFYYISPFLLSIILVFFERKISDDKEIKTKLIKLLRLLENRIFIGKNKIWE